MKTFSPFLINPVISIYAKLHVNNLLVKVLDSILLIILKSSVEIILESSEDQPCMSQSPIVDCMLDNCMLVVFEVTGVLPSCESLPNSSIEKSSHSSIHALDTC